MDGPTWRCFRAMRIRARPGHRASPDGAAGPRVVGRFSDGEVTVELMENVRGRDVFIVQPTCPPVNDNLMELLVMVDACRRASAQRITAVVPYFGYSRQDRRPRATRVADHGEAGRQHDRGAGVTAC
jgi:ribose-phosphate pyrophosphokinase